jgi:hypothetical protein
MYTRESLILNARRYFQILRRPSCLIALKIKKEERKEKKETQNAMHHLVAKETTNAKPL